MLALVDDERLAALAAGGSEHAFGELVQRHEARLLMVSRAVLRSDDDARDAVQNALLKAFRALQDGQLRGAPRPWLARIAHNEARSLARVRREFAPLDPEALGAAGDPHDVVLAKERLALLVADVAALPERLRAPLLLRAEAGLSYDAIALQLGTSASAARQAVCDARATLEAEAGAREADCADIRTILTGPDRRRHRSRRVRGHLRACVACRAWRPERRPLLLLPGGGMFWNVAQWVNTLFTAGSGSVAGPARSTAVVVAVSAGSLTLAVDRPPRERPRSAETPRKASGPTPVLVATATPDTVTYEPAGEPTVAGAAEPHGIVGESPGGDTGSGAPPARRSGDASSEDTRSFDRTPERDRRGGAETSRTRGRTAGDTRDAGGATAAPGSRASGAMGAARDSRASGGTGAARDTRASGGTVAARDSRAPGGTGAARDTRASGESLTARETRASGERSTADDTLAPGAAPAGDTRGWSGDTRAARATPTATPVPTSTPTPAQSPAATTSAEPSPSQR